MFFLRTLFFFFFFFARPLSPLVHTPDAHVLSVKGAARPRQVRATPGVDEYLCLQAVHALATAISSSSRSDEQLGEAAIGQGGSLFLVYFLAD